MYTYVDMYSKGDNPTAELTQTSMQERWFYDMQKAETKTSQHQWECRLKKVLSVSLIFRTLFDWAVQNVAIKWRKPLVYVRQLWHKARFLKARRNWS